jgi:DNA gyrase subunit A
MITCKSGVTIRMKVADISEQGRATQGVKLIRLDEGDEIAAITRLDVEEVINGNGNGNGHLNGENGETRPGDAAAPDQNPEATNNGDTSSEQMEP